MRHRTSGCSLIIGVIVAAFFVASAPAATVIVGGSEVGTNGGPFTAYVQPGSSVGIHGPNSQFKTFCVEVYEDFYPGTPYDVVVSTDTVFGTSSTLPGAGVAVALQPGTAYLYKQFLAGVYTTTDDLQAVQDAMWILQGYASFQQGSPAAIAAAPGLAAAATLAANGSIGDVRVMQMWDVGHVGEYDHKSQDLLVVVPTPAASLAGMTLLGGLGLVSWIKRRGNFHSVI